MKELDIKLAHLWAWLDQHQADALRLRRESSFTGVSCGIYKACMIREVPLYP